MKLLTQTRPRLGWSAQSLNGDEIASRNSMAGLYHLVLPASTQHRPDKLSAAHMLALLAQHASFTDAPAAWPCKQDQAPQLLNTTDALRLWDRMEGRGTHMQPTRTR